MSDAALLLCGHDQTDGIAKIALDQLRRSVDEFATRALTFLPNVPSDDLITLGPFCTRVLLEAGCAALVGRLDCFRMLYLSEFQAQPEYEISKRARSAFSWLGDVIPDEKGPAHLWSLEHDTAKISRALFSKHMEHLYWKPAVERMLDFAASRHSETPVPELLQLDSETYIDSVRGRSMQLYSTLSKGVHWEFFTNALIFDSNTVKTLIRDTILLLGHLGLTSHFVPTAYARLTPAEAMTAYVSLRQGTL